MEFDEQESETAVASYVCDALPNRKTKEERITNIESLSNILLLHILSFLNTSEAVKTSIISKRWKDLWKYVPCLKLDYIDFKSRETFQTFVNCVLLRRKTEHLNMFYLRWLHCDQHKSYIIDTWLRHIGEYKPRDLKVEINGMKFAWFPSYLLRSPTLESLCLHMKTSEVLDISPKMVNLPFLKSLSLHEVVIHDGTMNELISACPLLEQLSLLFCSFQLPEIASLILKDLTISGSCARTLRICTPNLVYLSFGVPPWLLTFENMPHLNRAVIMAYDRTFVSRYDGREVKVLHSLANAREIEFVGNCEKKCLEKELQNFHVFRNLKRLSFQDFTINNDLQPIASFLPLAPNLEKLSLYRMKLCSSTGEEEVSQYFSWEPYLDVGEHFELCNKIVLLVRENSKSTVQPMVFINGVIV